jgi:hypothetical protein
MPSVHADDLEGGAGGRPAGRAARRSVAVSLAVSVVAVLLAGACAGGGGGSGAGGRDGRGRLRPGAEQPPADDVEAVEPVLADLLERHDDVVNEVLADPAVARDDHDPLVEEYLSLYSPDSLVPEQVVEAWVADADAGRSTHPVDPGHPAVASRIDGEIQAISDDEVRFPTCSEQRYASYEGDGALVEMVPYREQPGEATAVRVDGVWLLLQLDSFEGQAACRVREATEDPS